MKKDVSLLVEQNPEARVEKKVLAQAIVNISTAMKALEKSGLNRKAIVVLVRDATNEYKGTIERVLNALDCLARDYTK